MPTSALVLAGWSDEPMTERWFPDEMPMPAVNAETNGWWEAAAEHRLVVSAARTAAGPAIPRARCARAAASTASEWSALPGTGTVYTYTVVRQAFIPSLAGQASPTS